jgi:hypothetical protein
LDFGFWILDFGLTFATAGIFAILSIGMWGLIKLRPWKPTPSPSLEGSKRLETVVAVKLV